MEKQEAQRRLAELREQIRYHSRKYYTEDDPEISDFEYDQPYRQLETLEGEYPELVTADSPTQKIGGASPWPWSTGTACLSGVPPGAPGEPPRFLLPGGTAGF